MVKSAPSVATGRWLGELDAERQECAHYKESRFKQTVRQIRGLTREPVGEALPQAETLCNQAGVALALVPPLPKAALSGAAWWLSPRKAIILLSARHTSDDHLWFSFFHEAAHVLLHSKKGVYLDETIGDGAGLEAEANEWAANTLIRRRAWERFVAKSPRSERAVRAFADRQGIAPGIVVGRLQHQRLLPWKHLNGLKVRLDWKTTR